MIITLEIHYNNDDTVYLADLPGLPRTNDGMCGGADGVLAQTRSCFPLSSSSLSRHGSRCVASDGAERVKHRCYVDVGEYCESVAFVALLLPFLL